MMTAQPVPLSDRWALALGGLCRAVAAQIAGGALAVAMITLIWRRVRRIEGKILDLLARFRAGRLWVRTGRPRQVLGVTRGTASARMQLRFGWLLPMVPYEAAGFASQMRVLLEDPEMEALLAASVQARRVLAPLCRMLGIEAALLLPRAERAAVSATVAVEKVTVKRARKKRAPVDWGRIPLPRGVLTWARRQGFGKLPRD